MTRHLVEFGVACVGLAASRAGHAVELAGMALNQPVTMSECALRRSQRRVFRHALAPPCRRHQHEFGVVVLA